MAFPMLKRGVRGVAVCGLAVALAVPGIAWAGEEGTDEVVSTDPALRTALTQNGSHIGWNGYLYHGTDADGNALDPVQVNVAAVDGAGKWHFMATDGAGAAQASGEVAPEDMGTTITKAENGAPVLTDRVFYDNLNRNETYYMYGTLHLRMVTGVKYAEDGSVNTENVQVTDMGTLLGIHDGMVEFCSEDGRVFEAPMVWAGETAPIETDRTVDMTELGVPREAVQSLVEFSPRTDSGYVDVTFDNLDCTGLYGWTLVAYEQLLQPAGADQVPPKMEVMAASVSDTWPVDQAQIEVENVAGNVGDVIWFENAVPVKIVAVNDGKATLERYEDANGIYVGDRGAIDGAAYTVTGIHVTDEGAVYTISPDDPQGTGAQVLVVKAADMTDEIKGALTDGNRMVEAFLAPVGDDGDEVVSPYGMTVVAEHEAIWDTDQAVSFMSTEAVAEEEPVVEEVEQIKEEEIKEQQKVEQEQAEAKEKFEKEILPKTGVAVALLGGAALAAGVGTVIYRKVNGKLAHKKVSETLSGKFQG